MLFSINEQGDISIDLENGTICNEVIGDKVTSDFKTAKTIIITYFKHNNNLKKNFFKNKRNTLTDEEIKQYFDSELEKAFSKRLDLMKFVKYEYVNLKSSFQVLFFYYSESIKKIMLDYDIEI